MSSPDSAKGAGPVASAMTAGGFPPVRRSEIFGWCCFDFANSAFTTIIITAIYAVYFAQVVAQDDPRAGAWWGMALSFSQVVVIFMSPWIGAAADLKARKKKYLMRTALACSVATTLLFFPGAGQVAFALALVMAANIAFSLSENLCGSFLPEISTPRNVGRISGYGWSFGYVGGLLSLGLALAITQTGGKVAWVFVMTGIFFLVASLPTLLFLRERARPQVVSGGAFLLGWRAVLKTMGEVSQHRVLALFLVSFAAAMAGLFAIISFAALYSTQVLAFTLGENIALFAALQVSSAIGAFGFGFFQDRFGAKLTLIISLCCWLGISGWAAVCSSKAEFFGIGIVAGFCIGSLQSASRAVVSTLTPAGKGGEFFGFWGLFAKLGGVVGPLVMGLMVAATSFPTAALVNGVFFAIALLILLPLNLEATKPSSYLAAGV